MSSQVSEPLPNISPATSIYLPDLKGRTALVTGASQGIGRAVVESLLAHDVRCYGLAHEDFAASNSKLIPIVCDLRETAAIEAAVSRIAEESGELDYVVNVAGIDPKYRLEQGDPAIWDGIVQVNLRAYYLIIRACLPLLRKGAGKAVVNVSSINYRLGVIGRSIYSTTKAGILGLTTGLARELGRESIRINTISPGWVFTERQIQEYFGTAEGNRYLSDLAERQSLPLRMQPQDIANHILFYLSKVSRASTGHNCVVDAGWLLE